MYIWDLRTYTIEKCPHYTVSIGLSNRVDVCLWTKILENTNNQLKYAVIRVEKGSITTFELFFEADSVIYDLLELQIQSFLISYYM